ncbi:MAG: CPBP family glutamic-type intramembrane protease [Minicystis sp.]
MPGDPALPRREAAILLLAALLLTLVHYHGQSAWLEALLGPRFALYGWFGANVALLLGVPLLLIRFVLREPLSAFGLGLGRPRRWVRDAALLALLLLPIALLVAHFTRMGEGYPVYRPVLAEPWLLLPSTLGWGAYFFAWEFFFRGFLLFGLEKRLGRLALFVQLLPFVMAHYPKSEIESLAAIGGGLVFGLLALRGESFLGAWLLHWALATAINVAGMKR